MLTEKQFASSLRHALRHLYNPDLLRDNRLLEALALSGRPRVPSVLTSEITRAIESLKPEGSVPTQSRTWRVYEILLYRYVQQCSQQEVAGQLGLSIRQLRREETRATAQLAQRLAERFKFQYQRADVEHEPLAPEAESPASPFDGDLVWLRNPPPEEAVDLAQLLPALNQLVAPMANQHQVTLEVARPQGLQPLAGYTVAVRQILLSLLGVAIRRAPGGRVTLSARALGWQVELKVRGMSAQPAPRSVQDEAASLKMTHHLVNTCGGSLILSSAGEPFCATITLPAAEQLAVLVIDDNADALRLLQRYGAGTRYRVVGVRDPEQALAVANEMTPRIIVLDVMMPGVDGWEVLGRLRQHPLTADIPVVVCSILAEEELALSLGASGFLRKPVTRRDFLNALERQVHRASPAAR